MFEHLTLPGNQSSWWMANQKHLETSPNANQALKKSISSPFMNKSLKMYSMFKVKRHNLAELAWIIVYDHIYDCTQFLNNHLGGIDIILIKASTDCTEEFDAIHSDKAKKTLKEY